VAHAVNEHILVAVDEGIYNVRKATCAGGCTTCDGYTGSTVVLNNFAVRTSGTQQLILYGTYDNGTQYNIGQSWSSNKTAVATIGSSSGLVTGVASGSAVLEGSSGSEPLYEGVVCGATNPCQSASEGNSSNGTVFDVGAFGPDYIFVGTDQHIYQANVYQVTNKAGTLLPQPTGGTSSATSSDLSDTITQIPNGNNPFTFQFETKDQSTKPDDRTLTFKYDFSGQETSVQLNVTARKFFYATNDTPPNECTHYGYSYTYTYTPYTHPDQQPLKSTDGLTSTPVNETVNPLQGGTACTGNVTPGNGSINSNAQFKDFVSLCSNSPIPACDKKYSQSINVAGYSVRTNTLEFKNNGLTYTNGGPSQ
jgi:hypothetical protein